MPARTEAATRARMRRGEQRKAAELQARGWVCLPPEQLNALSEVDRSNVQRWTFSDPNGEVTTP